MLPVHHGSVLFNSTNPVEVVFCRHVTMHFESATCAGLLIRLGTRPMAEFHQNHIKCCLVNLVKTFIECLLRSRRWMFQRMKVAQVLSLSETLAIIPKSPKTA